MTTETVSSCNAGEYNKAKQRKLQVSPITNRLHQNYGYDFKPLLYPDIFQPTAPYPLYKSPEFFNSIKLLAPDGTLVQWNALLGKSVALYFADITQPRSKSFLPFLVNSYINLNEIGSSQKVEIVFVSLDPTENDYNFHKQRMPWLALPYNDPMVHLFKRHFRVMYPREVVKYDCGPRTSPPALMLISNDCRLLQKLHPAERGPKSLKKWDLSYRF